MIKVVTAEAMARAEAKSIEEGASSAEYMQTAGAGIALATHDYVLRNKLEKCATLLIGKGNNGGDAYTAGEDLLKLGYKVEAYAISEEVSELSLQHREAFCQLGGINHVIQSADEIECRGVILDGLLGTGFQGEVTGLIAEIIDHVNGQPHIVAIDIPSGYKIQAAQTLYLGLPKLAFFTDCFDNIGTLKGIEFGLDPELIDAAAYLSDLSEIQKLLPPIKRTRHKYEAGYVIAVAGSPGMAGAAILATLSALRSGAGLVRLFHPPQMEEEFSDLALEVIDEPYENAQSILKEMDRAGALLIGPGMGREPEKKVLILELLKGAKVPILLDADALYLLQGEDLSPYSNLILTPHHGEMRYLGTDPQAYVDASGVTLLLKGAPTFIYTPHNLPIIMTHGDPGMATAGSGDVLSGVIAALLAQKVPPKSAALLGATLHALAGEIAAKEKTSYSLIASDLIESLPAALKSV